MIRRHGCSTPASTQSSATTIAPAVGSAIALVLTSTPLSCAQSSGPAASFHRSQEADGYLGTYPPTAKSAW
jgi:hypothetical protein